jgi:hypothetical protein
MVSFSKPYFYHRLETWVMYVTMVNWFHSSISFVIYPVWRICSSAIYVYIVFLASCHPFINMITAS